MTAALDVGAFRRDGWLVVRRALSEDRLEELDAAVSRLERWAVDDGPGLHHFEQTDAGAVLAGARTSSTTTPCSASSSAAGSSSRC